MAEYAQTGAATWFYPGARADFAFRCEGDCMEPLFRAGDLALIRRQETFSDGEVIAVRIKGVELLKRAYKTPLGIFFTMDNAKYIPFIREEREVEVLGIAVGRVAES